MTGSKISRSKSHHLLGDHSQRIWKDSAHDLNDSRERDGDRPEILFEIIIKKSRKVCELLLIYSRLSLKKYEDYYFAGVCFSAWFLNKNEKVNLTALLVVSLNANYLKLENMIRWKVAVRCLALIAVARLLGTQV